MKKALNVFLIFLIFQLSTIFSINQLRIIALPSIMIITQSKLIADDIKSNEQTTTNNRINKSKVITLILAWFFGLHHFYLGNYITGIIYILLSFVGIGAILSLVDFVTFLGMNDTEWKNYLKSDKSIPWL
jgi:hypothetical protein